MLPLILLIIVFCLGVGCFTLFYWYEAGNNYSPDIPPLPLTLTSVLRVWGASLSGLILVILCHPLYLFQCFSRQRAKRDPSVPDGPPLLFIHGLYHNNSGWFFMRRHMHTAGFSRTHTLGYSSRSMDIERLTAMLDAEVERLAALYPGEKPLLIGHSLGGLIIRNWLTRPENPKRVGGVLTLGTPHRGSKLAALALGKLGRTLLPSNPFFADLERREAPASIPCVSLAARGDTMVFPLGNLVPVTPGWQFRLAPFTSHAGLMFRPAVIRMAAWELSRMDGGMTR